MDENTKRIEELNIFYKTCIRELEKANNNVNNYIKKVDDMYSYLYDIIEKYENPKEVLMAYDATLSDLTSISDFARKFNIAYELKYSENFDIIPKTEKFTYPKPDLTKFNLNYEGNCLITHIKDKEKRLFYINEIENPIHMQCVELLKNYFKKSPKKFIGIPKEGEVFGLYMKGYLVRVVRENNQCDRNKINELSNVYLIDIGEIVKISDEMKIYALPYECSLYPAQAILCKLEMIDSNTINLENYLSKIVYMKHKFVVISKDESMLHLNLISNTNPFMDYFMYDNETCEDNNYRISLINPFRQYYCVNTDISNNTEQCTEVNDFFIDKSNPSCSQQTVLTALQNNDNIINDGSNNDIEDTLLQNKIMYSLDNFKTLNISNNYDTDETNIQKPHQNDLNVSEKFHSKISPIYDDNLKYEFDKMKNSENQAAASLSTSQKVHLRDFYNEVINGNTIKSDINPKLNMQEECNVVDKFEEEHKKNDYLDISKTSIDDDYKPCYDIRTKLIYPSAGEIVILIPTHIINVEFFFAHHHNHELRYQATLSELIRNMNQPEIIAKYTKIQRPLVVFELVIAMYKDGYWYRARIMDIYDEHSVKVFYMDYGNADIISKYHVRKWEPRFEYLPFQAIRCKISGIKGKLSIAGLEYLNSLLLNKSLRAKILNILDENLLDVKLTNTEGYDVANQLVLMGYAIKK